MSRSLIYRMVSSLPSSSYTQQYTFTAMSRFLHKHKFKDMAWLEKVFSGSKIAKRHFVYDPAGIMEAKSFPDMSLCAFNKGIDEVKKLNKSIFHDMRDKFPPFGSRDISKVILGSEVTYGMNMTDFTHLTDEFKIDLDRQMIIGRGCAGGALALNDAHNHLKGNPTEAVQTVHVENISKVFRHGYNGAIEELASKTDDESKHLLRNLLIPAVIMGDAAVSTIVIGSHHPHYSHAAYQGCPIIVDTQLVNMADLKSNVCFVMKQYGQLPLLKPGVPELGSTAIHMAVIKLLDKHQMRKEDIDFWIVHPGSYKVLNSVSEKVGLSKDQMKDSYKIWETHGNCMSPTVMLVLQEYLQRNGVFTIQENPHTYIQKKKIYGVLTAVGPGLTAIATLIERWI